MPKMATSSNRATQEREREFRDFMQRLLAAQGYNFLEERLLFSPETLQQILTRFCEIIADDIGAQSCTIHLRMYDPKLVDSSPFFREAKERQLDEFSRRYRSSTWKKGSSLEETARKIRERHMGLATTFPYWEYRKGAARLVAANPGGPWESLVADDPRGLGTVILESGVMAEIVQDNFPAIRDRLSMRATRGRRKLGYADAYIWPNRPGQSFVLTWDSHKKSFRCEKEKKCPSVEGCLQKEKCADRQVKMRCCNGRIEACRKAGLLPCTFRSFYGVPIRIHAGGEVIGVLKVENKQYDEKMWKGIKTVLGRKRVPDVITGILTLGGRSINTGKSGKSDMSPNALMSLQTSLLSLAYLEDDLEVAQFGSGVSLDTMLKVPYPQTPLRVIFRLGKESDVATRDAFRNLARAWRLWQTSPEDPQRDSQRTEERTPPAKDESATRNRSSLHFTTEGECPGVTVRLFDVFDKEDKDIQDLLSLPPFTQFVSASTERHLLDSISSTLRNELTKEKKQRARQYVSLLPPKSGPPPLQVFADSLEGEQRLWKLIAGEGERLSLAELQKCVSDFRKALGEELQHRNKKQETVVRPWDYQNSRMNRSVQFAFAVEKNSDVQAGACYSVTFNGNQEESFTLHVFIPPERTDNSVPERTDSSARVGDALNTYWREGTENQPELLGIKHRPPWPQFRGWSPESSDQSGSDSSTLNNEKYNGNYIGENIVENKQSTIDLLVDRLAARIQAFTHAIPVPDFTDVDTTKLSWAALEIGKLIECEISYRANRHKYPIPLTAMEFQRIPISDLSFVDELRERHEKAAEVQGRIDHYFQDMIRNLNVEDRVRYTSRVKDYRSYLARIGERHEGLIRGSIAVWFYILACFEGGEEKPEKPQPIEMPGSGEWGEDRKKEETPITKEFRKALANVRWAVERTVELTETSTSSSISLNTEQLEKVHEWLRGLGESESGPVVTDLGFRTPPFKTDDWSDAWKRITGNLEHEGLLLEKLSETNPRDGFTEKTYSAFEELIFRRYDAFAIASVSLAIQLLNMPGKGRNDGVSGFGIFYRTCFELRKMLSMSPQEMQERNDRQDLVDLFAESGPYGETWAFLLSYIDRTETETFIKAKPERGKKNTPAACLNPRGVYKRIRTLHTILRHQRPSACLDWELGRFDMLGCRANCLLKNQVFAVYERAWNCGDPFFYYNSQTEGEAPSTNLQTKREVLPFWLSLRTNVLRGEGYTALQIAALADPEAMKLGTSPEEEIEPRYDLKAIQKFLGNIAHKHARNFSTNYNCFRAVRKQLVQDYSKWYKEAQELYSGTDSAARKENFSIASSFGAFLGEAVIDCLIELGCDPLAQPEMRTSVQQVLRAVAKVLKEGRTIAPEFLKQFNAISSLKRNGKKKRRKRLIEITQSAYKKCEELLGEVAEKAKTISKERGDYYETNQRFVEKEGKVFEKLLNDEGDAWRERRAPLFYCLPEETETILGGVLTPDRSAGRGQDKERLEELIESLEKENEITMKIVEGLAWVRCNQREYLFRKGSPDKENELGLWLREREAVLNRIQNYVLLFDPKKDGKRRGKNTGMSHWTAYDLFYHLRRLVPVEIQVRTELANTMAEQYHGPVYKGRPPLGTEFARKRMNQVGEALNVLDKEMEIDYEDYIGRYEYERNRP